MQISTPIKIRKIAQLQETIVFTCNPIINDNAHHNLPEGIHNPKQDRKIWVIKFCCFPDILIVKAWNRVYEQGCGHSSVILQTNSL